VRFNQERAALEILGIDFSGARSDSSTWMAEGFLEGQVLTLGRCRPVTRAELTERLAGAASQTIAALDFPFSVPLSFAQYWMPAARSMPDLWRAASSIELARFIEMRDAFVPSHGEPKRICDALYPECYSCLHKTNPNMLPMTFYGMRMLSQLWAAGCEVPPLEHQGRGKPVLLEVMPGAVLRGLGLPYKGYKNGARATELRGRILTELPNRVLSLSKGRVLGLPDFRDLCLASHDCLDAVVAFIAAALWAARPDAFRLPESQGLHDCDPTIQIEGWLYAPVHLRD
jgi:hypothetical protein